MVKVRQKKEETAMRHLTVKGSWGPSESFLRGEMYSITGVGHGSDHQDDQI